MLHALLVAFSLDGVLPVLLTRRRPIAVIRFDRVREPRHVTNLRRLAERLTHGAPAAQPVSSDAGIEAGTSRTAGGAGGGVVVLFTQVG